MEFSRPGYWSGKSFPSPGYLPNPGIEPRSSTLQADSLPAEPQGKPKNTGMGSLSLVQGIFLTQGSHPGLLHCRWILYQLSYQESPRAIALVYRMNAGMKVEAQSNQKSLFWIKGDGICKVREAREGIWPYSGNSQQFCFTLTLLHMPVIPAGLDCLLGPSSGCLDLHIFVHTAVFIQNACPLLHQMSEFSPSLLPQHEHQGTGNLPQMFSLQDGSNFPLRILTAFYLYLSNGISNEASQLLKPGSLRPRVTFLLGPIWCYPQHLTFSGSQSVVSGPEVSAGLGTCKKCRLSGPTPDLLIQKLWRWGRQSVL